MNNSQDSTIFRQKLFLNFKESGLVSRLQTTLRANLLQKLQKPSPHLIKNQQSSKPFHLKRKFLQNIIQNYLQSQNLQYTMSIFLPQCNLDQKDLLTNEMIEDIINLSRKNNDKNISVLELIVESWVSKYSQDKRERSTQTQIQGQTVGKKLERIQKDYLAKIDYWKLIPNKQISDTPSLYQHQLKLTAKFQAQKQKIKLDAQRVLKVQLDRKYQSQYEFRLNQITKQHQKRLQQLKQRQKQIFLSLEKKKSQLQTKGKQLTSRQLQLILKYETHQKQIQIYYKNRQNQIQKRQKEFWKKELQLKAKKKEYQDTIRLVKQKVIGEAGQMPQADKSRESREFNFYN